MREADIAHLRLKERFADGVDPRSETESRLGLELPNTRALIEAIHADLAEGPPHGIHWWEPKANADRAPRILISDYLYACTANVLHHLVAARLHHFEFVDWSRREEQSRNERTQIVSPGRRNDHPRNNAGRRRRGTSNGTRAGCPCPVRKRPRVRPLPGCLAGVLRGRPDGFHPDPHTGYDAPRYRSERQKRPHTRRCGFPEVVFMVPFLGADIPESVYPVLLSNLAIHPDAASHDC